MWGFDIYQIGKIEKVADFFGRGGISVLRFIHTHIYIGISYDLCMYTHLPFFRHR